jgi:hypothetical protein
MKIPQSMKFNNVKLMREKIDAFKEEDDAINELIVRGYSITTACQDVGVTLLDYRRYTALKHLVLTIEGHNEITEHLVRKDGRIGLDDVFKECEVAHTERDKRLQGRNNLVLSMANMGAAMEDILDMIGVTDRQFGEYLRKYPQFARRLEDACMGRAVVQTAIENISDDIKNGNVETSKFVVRNTIMKQKKQPQQTQTLVQVNIGEELKRIADCGMTIDVSTNDLGDDTERIVG